MLVFALTNGYASTLIMLAAVVEPSLEENEVDVSLCTELLPGSSVRTSVMDTDDVLPHRVLSRLDRCNLHGLLSDGVSDFVILCDFAG